ncbi:MAG: hypothetical protein LIP23_05275 [Planctomycetes bacterium]|nr:hypothetical protein [Planctomycetota bacterium]
MLIRLVRRAALAALLVVATVSAAAAMENGMEYSSVPKGVVVEGLAVGIEPAANVTYDRGRNMFVINGNAYYRNPLTMQEFREVLQALSQHNHFGVSLRQDRSIIAFGSLDPNSSIARDLTATDRILGGVVFGMRQFIGNRRLPGGYTPQTVSPQNRRVLSACTFIFKDYQFARNEQGVYERVNFTFNPRLRPIRRDRSARDGGYVADQEAASRGEIEPTDRANLAHLMANQREYLAMPEVDKAVRIGEAAAFIRWIRGGSTNRGQLVNPNSAMLTDLMNQMR